MEIFRSWCTTKSNFVLSYGTQLGEFGSNRKFPNFSSSFLETLSYTNLLNHWLRKFVNFKLLLQEMDCTQFRVFWGKNRGSNCRFPNFSYFSLKCPRDESFGPLIVKIGQLQNFAPIWGEAKIGVKQGSSPIFHIFP